MKTNLNFKTIPSGDFKCETDLGSYHLWKDWKNDCWVVDCPDGDTLDFGFKEDAIEAASDDYYNRTSAR